MSLNWNLSLKKIFYFVQIDLIVPSAVEGNLEFDTVKLKFLMKIVVINFFENGAYLFFSPATTNSADNFFFTSLKTRYCIHYQHNIPIITG